jgi:hypothetical protein
MFVKYLTIDTGGALSPGVKRLEREYDRSPLSSSEIKNGGAVMPSYVFMAW